MRTLLLLLPLLLCPPAGGAQRPPEAVREYFIAAVEIGWDYIHLADGDRAPGQRGGFKAVTQKYIKAVYREYTNATFSIPRPRPAWTGIQGPVIVAQAGERVVVHFKNLASQPYSISPVGITYWKQSEGAGYDDSTAGQEKEDDAVPPGGYYKYIWDISPNDGPTISDPDCLTYSYSSQVDTVRDMNSGLIGALLICKPSAFTEDGQRKFQAFVLLFAVFDETKSWYGEVGERMSREKFRRSDGRKEYHTINGYVNSTLSGLTVCQGYDPVFWHMIGLGTTPEIHSIRFQDHTLQVLNHRKVTVEVTPMTFVTAEMRPATIGRFLISCEIHAHRYDGMNALFTVEKCPDPVPKDLRHVKTDDDYDGGDEEDGFSYAIQFLPKGPELQARSGGGQQSRIWRHFIAAEEVTWNYAPHLNPTDSELQSRNLPPSPHHLGYTYKKVMFVEYTDEFFTEKKNPSESLLGPILKGKVDDKIYIIFKNLASRPFNIYPNGLTKVLPFNVNAAVHDLRTLGIPPNKTFVYIWKITSDDGPLEGDPQCLTQLYQSTISPEQDLASGLVGTLLICKTNAIGTRGNLQSGDKKQSLIFTVFDENRSWYFKENMQRSILSSYNTSDPEFYKSNVIYSINGIMFSKRQFVMCQTDVSLWHVANVGTRSEFLSVYFTGNLFQYQGLYQSVLTLFPMTAVTIPMETEVIGEWEISAFDSNLRSRGMSIRYTVRPCNDATYSLVDNDLTYEDISEYVDRIDQPRGLRPENGTMLVRECRKSAVNNTSDQNVTLVRDKEVLCKLRRVPVASVKREQVSTDEGIPEDILTKVERDGSWKAPENQTQAEDNRGGRQKREAGGNWTQNNDISLDAKASTGEKIPPGNTISPKEDMSENYIYSDSESLLDDMLDVDYNLTDGNTTEVNLSLDYDDYNNYNSEGNASSETFGTELFGPRSGETRPRHYYIAAEEITWDYGIKTPYQLIKPRYYFFYYILSHCCGFIPEGVFGTVEMRPPTVGTWLVECTIGDYQLAGMRAKLLVYDPRCVLPQGMKSGRIEDSQITASDHSGNWEPRLARLDMTGYYNAWMGKGTRSWLQVDLLRPTLLHGIQTQGVRSKLRDHYTAIFSVSYSIDQETWTTYRGNSSDSKKIFRGNLDSTKVKDNSFSPPFVARYVRIHPHGYKQKPALRLELLGCDLNSCSLPLGLEKGLIPDSSLNASSFYWSFMRSWRPSLARLHQSGGANAWRPKNNNPHEWLQVDLGKIKRVTGVITQGARSMLTQMMVTEFSVTFSQDGHSWSSVLEKGSQRERIFTGNEDPDEEALTVFEPPLFAHYLRIHPRGWVNDIALRLEVLGCDTQQGVGRQRTNTP
ncbi:PREDICTED: coagulation factor VIII-like [Cyprinodon variegatus]|uniref:coagulation factor VIII-like n=1 Tax=Cyprinodon variegatus TaxID=28743 RepID=UPI000742CC86|nr:PREDICTED: coagulation factor VIII-like [Cyprinodon variegatus]